MNVNGMIILYINVFKKHVTQLLLNLKLTLNVQIIFKDVPIKLKVDVPILKHVLKLILKMVVK